MNETKSVLNDYHRKQSAHLVKVISAQPPRSPEECIAQAVRLAQNSQRGEKNEPDLNASCSSTKKQP